MECVFFYLHSIGDDDFQKMLSKNPSSCISSAYTDPFRLDLANFLSLFFFDRTTLPPEWMYHIIPQKNRRRDQLFSFVFLFFCCCCCVCVIDDRVFLSRHYASQMIVGICITPFTHIECRCAALNGYVQGDDPNGFFFRTITAGFLFFIWRVIINWQDDDDTSPPLLLLSFFLRSPSTGCVLQNNRRNDKSECVTT